MLRGHQTRPGAIPTRWRGPLPDVSIQRHLNTGGGYAQVPLELAFSDISDLGILTWALIKLSFQDRAEIATYRQFADELGLGHLQDNAVKRRFLAAVPSLIDAGWLKRSRAGDNQMRYQAMVPEGAGRRYAMIRRRDIALLTSPPRGREQRQITVAHLADFARWQLECGARGWTAETTEGLARHWGVSPRTLRQRRDSIRSTKDVPGLITVEERPGHADLIWLAEVADPYWTTPSTPDNDQRFGAQVGSERVAESVPLGVAEPVPSPWQISLPRGGEKRTLPYKELLTNSLTEDLTDLGGASATPLSFTTHELSDAAPQAAPRSTTQPSVHEAGHRRVAGQLLASQPVLVAAAPHWRSRMVDIIGRALDRGLDPAHLARALQRVIDDGEVERHCEIVRAAAKQAWADQLAGMCAGCGVDPRQHLMGCPIRAVEADTAGENEVEVRQLIIASLAEASAGDGSLPTGRLPAPEVGIEPRTDPLQPYLDLNVPLEPDAAPEVVAQWLTAQIARGLVDVDVDDVQGRRRALDRSVAWWASKMSVEQHQSVELAAAQLHFALTSPARRAS